MKLRRIATLVVALLAVAGMVFAGGSTGGSTAGGTVVVDTMAYGDNSNPEGQAWARIVDQFEAANPSIDIQYEMLYDEAYHQKVSARLAAGDIPDLAYTGADARWGAPWAEAGAQADHRPLMDPNYYDLSLISPMGDNGEIWYIPLGTDNITTVLYMNEALVKELGFSTPSSYADLVAMVPAARARGIDVVAIAGAEGWVWGSCLMSTIIARVSGDANWVAKAVAGEYKFTDAALVDSLKLLQRMVADGVINANSVQVDYGSALSNYSNGQALFMVDGHWRAGSVDPAVAETTKLLAWPSLPGEKAATAGTVASTPQTGYGLTTAALADPAVRDAAVKFLQYYYSHEETAQRLIDGAIVVPVLKNFQFPAGVPSISQQKVPLAAAATGTSTNVIDAFLSGTANDALNTGMQQIVAGTATPEQVAQQVETILRNQ